ncbi:MAG TPA: hypothetical protein V6D16_20955 [Candidatus Obscuribacterales bacterium]
MAKQALADRQAIAKNLDQLATAWPAVTPPTKPVLTPDSSFLIHSGNGAQTIEQETQKVAK